MQDLYLTMLDKLRTRADGEVYSSFDAVPVRKKSPRRFAVLTLEGMKTGKPFPVQGGEVHPFALQMRVDVLCPMDAYPEEAMLWFETKLLPVILNCTTSEVRMDPPDVDLKLQKLVCSWHFAQYGEYRMMETEGEA